MLHIFILYCSICIVFYIEDPIRQMVDIMDMDQQQLFFSDNEPIQQLQPPAKRRKAKRNTQSDNKKSEYSQCKLEQGDTQLQLAQRPSNLQITKETIHQIFFELCESIDDLTYSPHLNQPPFYQWVFTQLVQDLKYRQSIQVSTAKIRTSLIKKVTDDFVRQSSQSYHKRQSQRMTAVDKRLYERSNIQPPPNNVNNQYIAKLFQNQQFKKYYIEYIQDNRLMDHFLLKCYEEVSDLTKFIQKAIVQDDRIHEQFKKLKKPMTLSDVRNYEVQSYKILQSYCK